MKKDLPLIVIVLISVLLSVAMCITLIVGAAVSLPLKSQDPEPPPNSDNTDMNGTAGREESDPDAPEDGQDVSPAAPESGSEENSGDGTLPYTLEEAAAYAHVVGDFKYVGIYELSDGTESLYAYELIFEPVKAYKGDLPKENIYLIAGQMNDPDERDFTEGETYFFCLSKIASVYNDHDKYASLYKKTVSSSDDDWKDLHDRAKAAVKNGEDLSGSTGEETFTTSDKIADMIAFAPNIFELRVESMASEDGSGSTAIYNCSVAAVAKGMPSSGSKILVQFFTDSVSVGEAYFVLLSEPDGNYYTIASKNAVYTLDEAEQIPELKQLLDNKQTPELEH